MEEQGYSAEFDRVVADIESGELHRAAVRLREISHRLGQDNDRVVRLYTHISRVRTLAADTSSSTTDWTDVPVYGIL